MSRTRIPLSRQDENARLMKERLEMSTAEIGLSVRTTNCLEERGIFTVRDLLNSTPDQLLAIANFGEKTLEEVYKALEKIGFYRASKQAKAALIQAEERGNPVAEVLQIQAGVSRLRRSVKAEEAAAKAAVKMVGPLFLLFACIMLLVMGPMVLTLMEQ